MEIFIGNLGPAQIPTTCEEKPPNMVPKIPNFPSLWSQAGKSTFLAKICNRYAFRCQIYPVQTFLDYLYFYWVTDSNQKIIDSVFAVSIYMLIIKKIANTIGGQQELDSRSYLSTTREAKSNFHRLEMEC